DDATRRAHAAVARTRGRLRRARRAARRPEFPARHVGARADRHVGARADRVRDRSSSSIRAVATTLLRTPLYDRHVSLGAKMVPFAGWEMPVQYDGVIQEHRAVRADAGAFDVSHMGELEVEGPRAREFLQGLLANDLDRIEPGQAQYTLLTNEHGGIVDDLIAYRLSEFHYLLIVNASNREGDFRWLKEH